jgi:hypothetical protein
MSIGTLVEIELWQSAETILDLEKVASWVTDDLTCTVVFGETLAVVVVRGTCEVLLQDAVLC